jgi:hypothetical protein
MAKRGARPGIWDAGSPRYAVGALGPGRYCWVAYSADGGADDLDAASGEAGDEAEAVEQALRAAGQGARPARRLADRWATEHHRRGPPPERAADESRAGGDAPLELLYLRSSPSEDAPEHGSPHRVVRKTVRSVYVAVEPYDPTRPGSGTWWDSGARTDRLDRAALERDGHARATGTGAGGRDYYLRPEPVKGGARTPAVPDCFRTLHLTPPCTRQEITRAYRALAGRAHPDRGGSHEAFLALRRAYEQALRLAGPAT